jgi:hypothetical protein
MIPLAIPMGVSDDVSGEHEFARDLVKTSRGRGEDHRGLRVDASPAR